MFAKIVIAVCACLVMPVLAQPQPQPQPRPLSELARFAEGYYLNPQPAKVPAAMQQAALHQLAWQPETEAATLAFFSCLFNRYPQRVGHWLAQSQALPESDQKLFNQLASRGPASLFARMAPSAALNDMYWSCYFATGQRRYLEAITNNLVYLGERQQRGRFLMAATARWSLAYYAASHLAVRAWLIELARHPEPRWRRLAEEIQRTPATEFSQRTAAVLKAQREAGIWTEAVQSAGVHWRW